MFKLAINRPALCVETKFIHNFLNFKTNLKVIKRFKSIDLNVYNTLSKKKEPFQTKSNSNVIYWYSCGPTVYDSAHIGHAW